MLREGTPLATSGKEGEGDVAPDHYGVCFGSSRSTVRLVAHYTVEIKR
jgi:hypothetical protein